MTETRISKRELWLIVALASAMAVPLVYLLALGPLCYLSAKGVIHPTNWYAACRPASEWETAFADRPEWVWSLYRSNLEWWAEIAGPVRYLDNCVETFHAETFPDDALQIGEPFRGEQIPFSSEPDDPPPKERLVPPPVDIGH